MTPVRGVGANVVCGGNVPKWTKETALQALEQASISPVHERTIDNGTQLTLPDGTRVNVFTTTGKAQVQGKECDEKRAAQEIFAPTAKTPVPSLGPAKLPKTQDTKPRAHNKVFIVYGHDLEARQNLELLLRRLNIEPVILANIAPQGDTIIEALEKHSDVHYAVVLLTPDDEGRRHGSSDEMKPRARQNVVLELGMFLSKLGRKRVAILKKGAIENPSDIGGLIYIEFGQSIFEAKTAVAAALQEAGFSINVADLLGS